jgi:hypothetical protein
MINSVLTSLVMFILSFFKVLKGVLDKIVITSTNSIDKETNKKRNIDSQDETLYVSQRIKGLGIHHIEIQNKCLLSKWLFKTD